MGSWRDQELSTLLFYFILQFTIFFHRDVGEGGGTADGSVTFSGSLDDSRAKADCACSRCG